MNNALYTRSTDVFDILSEIKGSKIKKYREDNSKIEWEDLDKVKEKISLYIPKESIDFLYSNDINIVKNSIFEKEDYSISKDNKITLYLHNFPRKEYIKKYIYVLGRLLNNYSPNNTDSDYYFGEYEDLIPYILEYLYLKDLDREDEFEKEHLYKLLLCSKKYLKSYSKHYDFILDAGKKMNHISSEVEIQSIEDSVINKKMHFINETGIYLSKLSSLDATLELADDMCDSDDYKSILSLLINNIDHDRSKIVNDLGLLSYNFQSIRKELRKR